MKRVILSFAVLAGLLQAADSDLNYLGTFIISKQNLESGMNGAYIDPRRDRRASYIERYYNNVSLAALVRDFNATTQEFSQYLGDAANFSDSDNLRSLAVLPGQELCLKDVRANARAMSEKFDEAKKKFGDVSDYLQQGIQLQSSYRYSNMQMAFQNNPSSSLRDLNDVLTKAQKLRREVKSCCDSLNPNSRDLCYKDPYLKTVLAQDLPKIKGGPTRVYSNPLADLNISPEDMAFFVQNDPRLKRAISEGDNIGAENAWSDIQMECQKQKFDIVREATEKHRQLVMFQDVAKAVQCTAPSILAHYGSNQMFMGSLAMGSVAFKTSTHQFGCPPEMLAAIADIRTSDPAKLTQRYLTDQLIPPMMINNPNDIPVQRRTFVYKSSGGLISNLGFLPDAAVPVLSDDARKIASIQSATTGSASVAVPSLRSEFLDGRRVSASRKINLASTSNGVRLSQGDSAVYARNVKSLASKIIEGGQDVRENVKVFSQGASETNQMLRGLASNLSSRGSSQLQKTRAQVSSNVRHLSERVARSRGISQGAVTSAGDLGSLLDALKNPSSSTPSTSGGRDNQGTNTSTPSTQNPGTSIISKESPTGGKSSTWDQSTPEMKLGWLKRRQQQLDSLIQTKDELINSLVKQINAAALEFAEVKATLITKFSAPVINGKLAGNTPATNVQVMKTVREESKVYFTEYGALNAKILDLKGRLAMEETTLNNFLMLRSAAGGQQLNIPSLSPANGLIPVPGVPRPQNLPNNPQQRTSSSDNSAFTQSLIQLLWMPEAWAAPTLSERLKFIDEFKAALESYVDEYQAFAIRQNAETLAAKKQYFAAYQEYTVLSQYSETMYEIPHDSYVVMEQFTNTLEVEAKDILSEFKGGRNPTPPSFDLIKQIEKAKADASESKVALEEIMGIYIKSYPQSVDEFPEAWFAPAASLLLE
ncbi:MAG: hypothetical protein KA116_06085 [Proteobacteria bacterium]|nr:hypothetical protein [Pseudomonadota bacterium]